MSLIDKFVDRNKTAELTITNPREVFNNVLKQTSGSAYSRVVKFDIFYQIYGFRGVVEGVGCSTIVANTALAIAKAGLSVCVIDTSILNPVQDVLLKTEEANDSPDNSKERFDWFDMPYTKKSPLHISSLDKNISVLSFKGKKRGIVDLLSTNDSALIVEHAFTELHNKFDIILVDICHETTEITAACIQQSHQIIQVWNDSPVVLSNLEGFITNMVTLSCPLDKMRFVVTNKLCKDAMYDIEPLLKQYRFTRLATSSISNELILLTVLNKPLFQHASTDQSVIDYTNCIIDIVCHILNILPDSAKKGTITSNDIVEGKVEGTLHKALADSESDVQVSVATTLEEATLTLEEDDGIEL